MRRDGRDRPSEVNAVCASDSRPPLVPTLALPATTANCALCPVPCALCPVAPSDGIHAYPPTRPACNACQLPCRCPVPTQQRLSGAASSEQRQSSRFGAALFLQPSLPAKDIQNHESLDQPRQHHITAPGTSFYSIATARFPPRPSEPSEPCLAPYPISSARRIPPSGSRQSLFARPPAYLAACLPLPLVLLSRPPLSTAPVQGPRLDASAVTA